MAAHSCPQPRNAGTTLWCRDLVGSTKDHPAVRRSEHFRALSQESCSSAIGVIRLGHLSVAANNAV